MRPLHFCCRMVPLQAPVAIPSMPEPNRNRHRRVPKPVVALAVPAFVQPLPTVPYFRFIDLLLGGGLWHAPIIQIHSTAHSGHALFACPWRRPCPVRMQAIFAGAWDGLRHTPRQRFSLDDALVWIMSVPTAAGPPDFDVKGAMLQGALK